MLVPFLPVAAPAPLPLHGPFAAVTVDAGRRRVFAAGARAVAVLDADTGKLLATIRIGGARSIALEPLGGHLFVGTGDGRLSEIDPDRKSVVRSVDAGAADVLFYDAVGGRIYAAGNGRRALAVIDSRTFVPGPPLAVPGGTPAQLTSDPVTRELYVAFADRPEIAVLDPQRGNVSVTFPVPGVPAGRVVRLDDVLGQIVVIASNGVLDIYDRAGTRRAGLAVPAGITGCDLDTGDHVLACTGPAGLTFLQLARQAAPELLGTTALPGPARAALDAKTHAAAVVTSKADGSSADLRFFSETPAPPSPAATAH